MSRRNVKKMGLGDFLGNDVAHYNPEAALPTGPRARGEEEEGRRGFGGRGGRHEDRYGDRGDRSDRRGGFEREREPMRSEQSDQWRGDRNAMSNDRFGREDRFGGGSSRYDRPSRDAPVEERPSYMRLNLQSRGAAPSSSPRRPESSGDKFSNAFGGSSRSSSSTDHFDSGSNSRGFNRNDEYESNLSSAMNRLHTNERNTSSSSPTKSIVDEEAERKARAQQARQERKQKAEEERKAAEEAKRQAAEAKKAAEEAGKVQAKKDHEIMNKVLASNKLGDELAAIATKIFAEAKTRPSGAVVFEAVTAKAVDVAKQSANWLAPAQYGALIATAMKGASVKDQVSALYALQQFLNTYDFPKGVLEKCFMALYSLDMIEERAFIEYKYDVENDVPGRMKAIVQTSAWLTWLETPEEEESEEEEA